MLLLDRVAIVFSALVICSAPATATQQQLQARLAKHFLSTHHAVPLHNSGEVKSGDVLHMPERLHSCRVTSATNCLDLNTYP